MHCQDHGKRLPNFVLFNSIFFPFEDTQHDTWSHNTWIHLYGSLSTLSTHSCTSSPVTFLYHIYWEAECSVFWTLATKDGLGILGLANETWGEVERAFLPN